MSSPQPSLVSALFLAVFPLILWSSSGSCVLPSHPLPSILGTETTQYQFAVRSPEYTRQCYHIFKNPNQDEKCPAAHSYLTGDAAGYKVDSQCQTLP